MAVCKFPVTWSALGFFVLLLLNVMIISECKSELKVGAAINLFRTFGSLPATLRVVSLPRPPWKIREPTTDPLQDVLSLHLQPLPSAPSVIDGTLHLQFCDDHVQLLQAYFQEFSIEGLEKPYIAFTALWRKFLCADLLGIERTSLIGESYSYVLVRKARSHSSERLSSLHKVVLKEAVEANITAGNESEARNFFRFVGTHYIDSFVTGNSLYQVLVYRRHIYKQIKERLNAEGVKSVTYAELAHSFSPWYVDSFGEILSASGNTSVEAWAAKKLRLEVYGPQYSSLFLLHRDRELQRVLHSLLGDEAILQLKLKSLTHAVVDEQRRQWLSAVMDNQLKLYEMNLCVPCHTSAERAQGCVPK